MADASRAAHPDALATMMSPVGDPGRGVEFFREQDARRLALLRRA